MEFIHIQTLTKLDARLKKDQKSDGWNEKHKSQTSNKPIFQKKTKDEREESFQAKSSYMLSFTDISNIHVFEKYIKNLYAKIYNSDMLGCFSIEKTDYLENGFFATIYLHPPVNSFYN